MQPVITWPAYALSPGLSDRRRPARWGIGGSLLCKGEHSIDGPSESALCLNPYLLIAAELRGRNGLTGASPGGTGRGSPGGPGQFRLPVLLPANRAALAAARCPGSSHL